MDHLKDRLNELDRFWDLSELMPKSDARAPSVSRRAPDTKGREVSSEPRRSNEGNDGNVGSEESRSTVLTRMIPARGSENRLSTSTLIPVSVYTPTDSLIHRVELKRWKSGYAYYGEFLADGLRLKDREGEPTEHVPFFSYVPQYNQLNEAQLAFYLWFRQCAREGRYIQADCSYVLLYVFELINFGERSNPPSYVQRQLVGLWNAYGEAYPTLTVKLADWICDYSLIHRLPPPAEGRSRLIAKVISLKEFFIPLPRGDVEGCARSLLRYCTSYDYHTSKFATPEHLPLFDQHVFGALTCAVNYYSAEGRLLSELSFEDSRLCRDAFAGALCIADQRYRLEVSYCSFSRSNELRFLVGDLVRYAENKLRAHLGIKSRMTVYSVPTEVARLLDQYFDRSLPKGVRSMKKREILPYEALYDLPRKPLSLAEAQRIESESWRTTRELVDAFEEGDEPSPFYEAALVSEAGSESGNAPNPTNTWRAELGGMFSALWETLLGDEGAIARHARLQGCMTEVLADRINEVAWERLSDAVLEETENGFAVLKDYQEELLRQLREEEKV